MQKGFIGKGISARKRAKYQKWINENVPERCTGDCASKAEAMATQFPELRVVGTAAWYFGHAWCVDGKERVVDPTAHQFNEPFQYPTKRYRLEREDFPICTCSCGDLVWPNTEGAKKYCKLSGQDFSDHSACYEASKHETEMDTISF